MTPAPFRVVGRTQETADVATIDIEPAGPDDPAGPAVVAPAPGQFMMLYAFGVGEAPISVSGCPTGGGPWRHTVRAVGPVTRALCALGPGDPVGVRGPFGAGWPVPPEGADLVVVGGGIGLAPLRPVILDAVADRARYGRVGVVVGARTPANLLYAKEVGDWRARFDLDVVVTVDTATADWRGEVGVVTKALPRLAFDPARAFAALCGPEVMMRVVARQLLDAGVAADRICVSLERNMQCGIGQCGHCQIGPLFVCAGGPVVPWSTAAPVLEVRNW